eukprot:SAG31_NODE_539_length_14296_cov_14.408819_4_plen_214_part_00
MSRARSGSSCTAAITAALPARGFLLFFKGLRRQESPLAESPRLAGQPPRAQQPTSHHPLRARQCAPRSAPCSLCPSVLQLERAVFVPAILAAERLSVMALVGHKRAIADGLAIIALHVMMAGLVTAVIVVVIVEPQTVLHVRCAVARGTHASVALSDTTQPATVAIAGFFEAMLRSLVATMQILDTTRNKTTRLGQQATMLAQILSNVHEWRC